LENLDFPLFFDIIAVEINAFLHAAYHLLYALIVELSHRAAKVAENLVFQLLSGSEMRPTQAFLQFREEMVVTWSCVFCTQ
jgi:hypothetical protein